MNLPILTMLRCFPEYLLITGGCVVVWGDSVVDDSVVWGCVVVGYGNVEWNVVEGSVQRKMKSYRDSSEKQVVPHSFW